MPSWPKTLVFAGVWLIGAFSAGCGGAKSTVTRLGNGTAVVVPSQGELEARLDAELARLGVDPTREVSQTPSAGCEVFDLAADVVSEGVATPGEGTVIRVSWTERLPGDYNQDGLVSISDLTALGQHFGATVKYEDPDQCGGVSCWPQGDPDGAGAENWRLARIDGNGDGQVYLSDITTIAQHWGEQLSGYRVYHKSPGEDSFSLVANPEDALSPLTVGRGQAVSGGADEPVRYSLELEVTDEGYHEFYVAGCGSGAAVGGGEGEEESPPSPILNPDFIPVGDPEPDPPPSSGDLLVIRDDGDNYSTNYDAMISDLDELEIDYYEVDWYAGIPEDFSAEDWDEVIWYRGGAGNSSEAGQTLPASWTDDEIDDYIQLLSDGHKLLLMSQSHGRNADVDFPADGWYGDGWELWYEAELGWELLDGTIEDEDTRHPWAASLGTTKGIGITGHYGYLESAPRNILATTEFGGRVPEGIVRIGIGGFDMPAECFSGTGSSGDVPQTLSFGGGGQFTAVGYSASFMKYHPYPNAGPYFHSGLSLVPLFEGGGNDEVDFEYDPDMAFISYGNSRAPDEDIGSHVVPNHVEGPGRLWVIGYPWAQTEITDSDTGEMTRAQMLQNVLAWLVNYVDEEE